MHDEIVSLVWFHERLVYPGRATRKTYAEYRLEAFAAIGYNTVSSAVRWMHFYERLWMLPLCNLALEWAFSDRVSWP